MNLSNSIICFQEHLPPDEPEDSKLKVEFRTQIERLRSKLQQIAGVDALNRFDEQRRIRPCQPPLASSSSPFGGGPSSSAYAALPGRMSNEQLAHELLMDPTFQLDESGGCSTENPVFHRIRESFHQAFWDSLVDDLKLETPCYVRVLRVLGEIRDGINDLAGSREAGNIAEAVDLDYIKKQAEEGLYTWSSCKSLIAAVVSVVQRVQAPKRDEETKAKWKETSDLMSEASSSEEQPRAFCKALEFLLDRVNAMRIDAANARLRLIAPVIMDHGIDYERGKFQDKLNEGSITLDNTKAWIHTTVASFATLDAQALDRLLEGRDFIEVHCDAVMSLLDGDTGVKPVIPETLSMDAHRLQAIRKELEYIATATTAIAAMNSEVKPPAEVIRRVSDIFSSPDATMTDAVERVIDNELHIAEGLRAKVRDTVVRCIEPANPVRKLIHSRLRKALRAMVLNGAPVPGNLSMLLPRIQQMAAKLSKLCSVNRTVHLPTYNQLIRESAMAVRSGA